MQREAACQLALQAESGEAAAAAPADEVYGSLAEYMDGGLKSASLVKSCLAPLNITNRLQSPYTVLKDRCFLQVYARELARS